MTAHEGESGPAVSAPALRASPSSGRPGCTAQAGPESVQAKGKAVTVTGNITRANWETAEYRGYAGRRVDLQFRTPTGAYTWVKTVASGADGKLETTVPATTDGCYRLVYGGNPTTGAAQSTSDCIDVT